MDFSSRQIIITESWDNWTTIIQEGREIECVLQQIMSKNELVRFEKHEGKKRMKKSSFSDYIHPIIIIYCEYFFFIFFHSAEKKNSC